MAPSNMKDKSKLQWWERKSVQYFAISIVVLIVLLFFAWWLFFRAYVSTNDARVSADIIRIAPVGVGGQIEKVNVQEGDKVTAGQILVEIDHRVSIAQLSKAKARFIQAQSEAKTIFDIAQADLSLAQINYDNTFLKSPIDGIVVQKVAQVGNLLEPGQVAVSIYDVDNAWVSANIEETSVAKIKAGQQVSIKIDEGGTLSGHVQEVLSATASQFSLLPSENASGNFTKVVQKIPIKIVLDPHPGRLLRAGQSVTIKIRVM